MQTPGNRLRRSRSARESLLGLFILAALGLFGVLLLWVKNFRVGDRPYSAIVEFQNASGMTVGTPVTYRGVKVGQVIGVKPQATGVDLKIEIFSDDLLIPKQTIVEARQAGLIGETVIDFTPLKAIPEKVAATPLDKECDAGLIVCDGDRIDGKEKLDVDALIRSLLKISNAIGTPEFTNNINRLTKNAADAASGIAVLTREVIPPVKSIGKAADKLGTTADEFQALAGDIRREVPAPLQALKQTADEFRVTARQLNEFQSSNRATLASTLRNVEATSTEIRNAIVQLRPVINQVAQAEFIQNLDALTSNAAQAAANLQSATANLSNPDTFLMLQQTLDSARMTFQNAQKITTDLDDLLGDPNFREQIRRLIQGLSRLVSSTQQLEQQTQIAETLAPIAAPAQAATTEIKRAQAENKTANPSQ